MIIFIYIYRGTWDLRRRFKVVIVVLLGIVVLVPSILAYASESGAYPFTRYLQVSDFVARTYDFKDYTANVSDSGTFITNLYFRIEPLAANFTTYEILFQIAYASDYHFDSMTLDFSVEPMIVSIYLEASSYDWSGARFTYDNNGGVLYSVPNMSWYGGGSTTLNFIMETYQYQSVNLACAVSVSMHRNAFLQLTSLKAYAYLSVPVQVWRSFP